MALVFIRHLPTDYNQRGLLQGCINTNIIPAAAAIEHKIRQNCRQLDQLPPFSHILCSELKRTQQTAEAYGYSASNEPLLNELDFGIYEGGHRSKMLQAVGEQWLNQPSTLILGEPLSRLAERVEAFFARYQEEHVLSFAHGAWLRAAYSMHKTAILMP